MDMQQGIAMDDRVDCGLVNDSLTARVKKLKKEREELFAVNTDN